MPVYFNGKLLTTPTVAGRTVDAAMDNTNTAAANAMVVIGSAGGGVPKVATRIGSPTTAKSVLRSGPLLEAIRKAFDPSSDMAGPSVLYYLRVDPATQSSLTLVDDADADAIDLTSTNYGVDDNRIKVFIGDGTDTGKRLITSFDDDTYIGDNIERNMFSVLYGSAAGTVTVNATNVILKVSAVAVATLPVATYATVQQMVDAINTVTGWTASVLDGNGRKATNTLDFYTDEVASTTALTVKADLQACVDWFNGSTEGYVDAVRVSGAGAPPANIAYTYLSGGSNGTLTNTDWSDALSAIEGLDVQWIAATTGSAALHSMIDAHAIYCRNYLNRERRAILGMNSGSSDTAAIAAAKALNSKVTSLAHVGYYDYDVDGNLSLFEPYFTGVIAAAIMAGASPGTAATNKTIKVNSLERELVIPTDSDALISGGVLCLENTGSDFRILQSNTTWLTDDKYNNVEQSCGFAADYTMRSVRDDLAPLKGEKQTPLLASRAVSIVETRLRALAKPEPEGQGVLAGDDANPAYKNITATISGDVLAVQYECSPVIPCNYILVTEYLRAYSGTATA